MIIHFALLADTESVDFKEVAREQTWKQAMIEKLQSIEKNHIWEPTELPPKKKPIEVKWIFKLKLNSDVSLSLQEQHLFYSSIKV